MQIPADKGSRDRLFSTVRAARMSGNLLKAASAY
jgi:hypothetical protein